MNRFDDEDKIISQFQRVNDNEVMFATQSETIEAVYLSIHTEALWNNWINSSGKSDPPPDYYSPKDELMMDVMRVDDHAFVDKKGKIQNPTNAGESKLYKELKESGIQEIFPNTELIVNAKTLLPSEQDHNYLFYKSKVEWTNKGEWEHPGQAVMKTLTCISPYPDYVQRLLSLFAEDILEETSEQIEIKYPPYTKDDFLNKVYMDEDTYNTLTELLEAKYNVILQGAPGVGKTFAAKRLAYSIMGQKDTSRVAMVQFHQSYSYEDFIQGYRPSKDGFELVNGAFYKFCKEAEEDNERPYFFIIDEINRGNLSKILGELMMLIEKDKRGEKIKLLYSNEWFTVPQNVRIIGMMNTADRSLALMDYALRRRFAFFDFAPAFSSEGFKNYLSEKDSPKLEKLIAAVESLNSTISTDESLGDGFRIGHSYFCTDDEITDEWLKSVVEYEVIPLIKEYWFDEPTKVRDWSATLRSAIK